MVLFPFFTFLYVYCRRLLFDDAFGVGEALNETAFGEGLVARGKHRDVTFEDISTIL
jgi:hypothetical protein